MYGRHALRAAAVGLAAIALALGPGVAAAGADGQAGPAPTNLSVEHLPAPVDVTDLSAPELGWQVGSAMQSGYEIQVATTPAGLTSSPDVWDSGHVQSTQNSDVAYAGPALSPSQGYYWRVRTWDAAGSPSAWSGAASFGTAPGTSWPDATPIWAAASPMWTDYTFQGTFNIASKYATVTFREANTSNFYLWQFRGAGQNTIAPQIQVNGSFHNLKNPEPLPFALNNGTNYDFKIVVAGSTFTTYLKPSTSSTWSLVDTTTDGTFSSGGIGFRTGSTEQVYFSNISVTDPSGKVLYANDFSDPNNTDFSCGTVTNGTLFVGTSKNCGVGLSSTNWAFMRGDVTLDSGKAIQWAHLYATASSTAPTRQFVYKLWVNGSYVGVGPTRPVGNEARYDGYDVAGLLRAGQLNTIATQAYTTSDQRFLAELVVRYTDGSTQTFGTGPSWTAINGSDVLPDGGSIGTSYYTAPMENYHADKFPFGFTEPGFDDSSWSAAATKPAFTDLEATPTGKVQQRLETPVSVVEYSPGDYFIDYGRTWIGGLSLDLDGTAGQVVDIRYGEVPSGPNAVKYQTNAGNDYEDRWTLKAGQQHLETWGLRVFRYVQVTGAPTGLTAADFRAEAYVYPFDESDAVFDSSDSNLNQVWALSRNTIESVNGDLYVDSWERERGVYEADSYLQLLSNLYLDGDPTLGEYSLNFLLASRTWPTEWPMYVILAMHQLYETTGDSAPLRAAYSALQAKLPDQWFDASSGLIHKTTGDTGASSCNDCDIVDWPASERDGYVFSSYNTVINAISYRSYADMADIANALGYSSDAASYQAKADAIKAAVNARMWDPSQGAYRDGLNNDGTPIDHYAIQASVFATAFGLADRSQATQVASYIKSRGMACSVYCAAFLLEALYDGGDGSTAYQLLTSTATNSWMHMISLGAGATMEAWDPSLKSNLTYSHSWAASPAFDIPQGLFGIEPTSPGYGSFEVKPQPGGLSWAHITVPTPNGEIGAAFDGDGSATDEGVYVPANSTATIYIPSSNSSASSVYMDGEAAPASYGDGYLEVDNVDPGCHVFSTQDTATAYRDQRLTSVCPPGYHAEQRITFTSTPASPLFGGVYRVAADGGLSGNPVEFSIDPSSDPGACQIAGAAVSFTGPGSCVIDANQDGDDTFDPAPQAQQRLTVGYSRTVTGTQSSSLTVASGESVLIAPGTTIEAPVTIQPGGALDIEQATVAGPFRSSGANAVRVCKSSVDAPVSIDSTSGLVRIGDDDGAVACAGNQLAGKVQITDNDGGVEFDDNVVGGPLTITGNTGALAAPDSGAVDVTGNQVSGPQQIQPH
jgi:alpha-L-rhamnosidase